MGAALYGHDRSAYEAAASMRSAAGKTTTLFIYDSPAARSGRLYFAYTAAF